MAEEVKLFGFWASPFSLRVEVALKLKGIPYEHIEEDLTNKSPLLLKYNQFTRKYLFSYTKANLLQSPSLFLNTLMKPGKDILFCMRILTREPWLVSGLNS
ncbi:hypothetical protein SLA2020_475670 [Shorea laevis]